MSAMTFEEWAAELFEFELCHECGGDARHHDPVVVLGNWFARCRYAAVIGRRHNVCVRDHRGEQ